MLLRFIAATLLLFTIGFSFAEKVKKRVVIHGSSTPLFANWIEPRLNNCTLRFLPRKSACGRVEPPSFSCNSTKPAVYHHFGCHSSETRLTFIRHSTNDTLAIKRLIFHTTNRSEPVVLSTPNPVTVLRNGTSKPFGLEIRYKPNETCYFAVGGADVGCQPTHGHVHGLQAFQRYSCDLSKSVGLIYDHGGSSIIDDAVPIIIWLSSIAYHRVLHDALRIAVLSIAKSIVRVDASASLTLLVNQRSVTPIFPEELRADGVNESDEGAILFRFAPITDYLTVGVLFTADWPFYAPGMLLEVTQSDIRRGRLAYRPPSSSIHSSGVSYETFEFPFSVSSSEGGSSVEDTLVVNLSPIDRGAPFVGRNQELIVERGRFALIGPGALRIEGGDLAAVKLKVMRRPDAGNLMLNMGGRWEEASTALASDFINGKVGYEHDGSEGDSDRIIFELSDGDLSFPVFFVVTIIDRERTVPTVTIGKNFKVRRDSAVMISTEAMRAWDGKSGASKMHYTHRGVLKGKLFLQGNASSVYLRTVAEPDLMDKAGYASSFTQKDIDNGRLWYVPPKTMAVTAEELKFQVTGSSNRSLEATARLKVEILSSTSERLRLNPGTSLYMVVKEKAVVPLEPESLQFLSDQSEIQYVISKAPFVSAGESRDAGSIVSSGNETVYQFSQKDVNEGKIRYQAANQEIGWRPLEVFFEFKVLDQDTVVLQQTFTIRVAPVNSVPPEIIQDNAFKVAEGGASIISSEVLKAQDSDTPQADLIFVLLSAPKNGVITWAERKNLTSGDQFLADDLLLDRLVYHHSGAEAPLDGFRVEVTDGVHSVSVSVDIHVELIDNDLPVLLDEVGYNVSFDVSDGVTVITEKNLLVYDPDTEDQNLVYELQSVPKYGQIKLRGSSGALVTSVTFTQLNVRNGDVHYELLDPDGISGNVSDLLIFTVGSSGMDEYIEVEFQVFLLVPAGYGLTVLIPASFQVLEANSKAIEQRHLDIQGTKARPVDILFKITTPPLYGNISVRGATGRGINTFTLFDIHTRQVSYLQSRHEGIEQERDWFVFDTTDGISTVRNQFFNITIYPVDDEAPIVEMGSPGPVVRRGKNVTITSDFLKIVDNDIGSSEKDLIITFTGIPSHGNLFLKGRPKVLDVRDTITAEDLSSGKLIYSHNSSKADKDSFDFSVRDGYHSVTGSLTIDIVNPNVSPPKLTSNTGIWLEQTVREVSISKFNLSAADEDSFPEELTFTVTKLPKSGRLFLKDMSSGVPVITILYEGSLFTQADVNEGHLFYSPDTDFSGKVSFAFLLSDGKHALEEKKFKIHVFIVDLLPPQVVRSAIVLKFGTGTAQVITSSNLMATDEVADREGIVYSLNQNQSSLLGYFAKTTQLDQPITKFTQADIDLGAVAFFHTLFLPDLSDGVNLTVSDGIHLVSLVFHIEVIPDPAFLPKLVSQRTSAFSNREKLLKSSDLQLRNTKTTPEKIIFTVAVTPVYGHLILRDGSKESVLASMDRFTQDDIIHGRLAYSFQTSNHKIEEDQFKYRILDPGYPYYTLAGNESRLLSFNEDLVFIIDIISVDIKAPHVAENTGIQFLGLLENGHIGYSLSRNQLLSSDDVTRSDRLKYTIVVSPMYGRLTVSGRKHVTHFSQGDVNSRLVSYVLGWLDKNTTNDSFVFSVADHAGNVLENQIFRIKWAYISMKKSSEEVDESSGIVNVTVNRYGDLSSRVSFTCQTEAGSALQVLPGIKLREGKKDFYPVSALLSLDPGETQVQCQVQLVDDEKHEGKETFSVQLIQPVNAVLLSPSSTTITILDPDDEPVLGFQLNSIEINENLNVLKLAILRTGDLSRQISVICYTQSGTATGSSSTRISTGDDYLSRPNSRSSKITFKPGVSKRKCHVTIVDDTAAENAETFSVHIVQRGNEFAIDPQRARVNVTIQGPNDQSTIQLSSSVYHVNESDGVAFIEVTRLGPDLSFPVSTWFTTVDNPDSTAKSGKDYVQLSQPVQFSPGVQSQFVKVTILDEDPEEGYPVREGPESFLVRLVTELGVQLGKPKEAQVIIDDPSDVSVLDFSVTEISIRETDGLLKLEVIRSGDADGVVTVHCRAISGTAEANTDFQEYFSSPLEFHRGRRSQEVYVIIKDDELLERNETFTIVLDRPSKGSRLGKSEVKVTIRDPEDVPSVEFSSISVAVQEPGSKSNMASVALTRTGDLSLISRVRCNSLDGSAQSGEDYHGISELVTFEMGEREATVSVEVLSDRKKEFGETFYLWLSVDDGFSDVVIGRKRRLSITIADHTPERVRFLAAPRIMSLINYGKPYTAETSIIRSGYPVICVSSCDLTYGDPKALDHCTKESVTASQTIYRWEISDNRLDNGELTEISFSTVFTVVNGSTLESVYFKPGSRLRCLATPVDAGGTVGEEMASGVVTVSRLGVCQSSRLNEKLIKTSVGRKSGERIHVRVSLPHLDGYIPVLSTRSVSTVAPVLTTPSARDGHQCSNFIIGSERTTQYTFLKPYPCANPSENSDMTFPYEHDVRVRSARSLDLYRHLDLEECQWTFQSCYSVSEFKSTCGGTSTEEATRLSMEVPLYIYYVRFSATTAWLYLSHETELAWSFSTVLSQPTPVNDAGYSMSAHLAWTKIYIRNSDGRLVIILRSSADFRGQFVLAHPDSDVDSHVESPLSVVDFDLELLESDASVHKPEQRWRMVSKLSSPGYSGDYTVVLVPCTVSESTEWSLQFPRLCSPKQPMTFSLPVNIKQPPNPNPIIYELKTRFELLHSLGSFLRDSTASSDSSLPSNSPFQEDATIYGRVMVEPSQDLGEGFRLRIERIYLCSGKSGFAPSYSPSNNQYGCLRPSTDLAHQFKVLDRSDLSGNDAGFMGIPFEAQFASDNALYSKLAAQQDEDGFSLKALPLHRAGAGYSWYLQVVFSIKGRDRRRRSLSSKATRYSHVSSLHAIPLDFTKLPETGSPDAGVNSQSQNTYSSVLLVVLGVTIPAFALAVLGVVLIVVFLQRRRPEFRPRTASHRERNPSAVSVEHRDNPFLASFLNVPDASSKSFQSSRVSPIQEGSDSPPVGSMKAGDVDESDDGSSVKSNNYSGDEEFAGSDDDYDDDIDSLPPKEVLSRSGSPELPFTGDSITTTL